MKYLKIVLFGSAIWAIPFVVSFFFYDKNGVKIDIFLFKTIMIITDTVVGAVFTILYFRDIYKNYFLHSVLVGVLWFLISVVFDLAILVPLSKDITLTNYFQGIGLRYLMIPAMTIVAGYLLEKK